MKVQEILCVRELADYIYLFNYFLLPLRWYLFLNPAGEDVLTYNWNTIYL